MFDIGGGGRIFFGDIIHVYIIMCVCTCLFFMCVKHMYMQKFLKLKFVFEPKKLLQKWDKKHFHG